MPAGKFNDLRHFCFRHLIGENAAYPHAMAVDMQHHLDGVLAAFGEEFFQDMNDELHRGIIVIQQQHLVEGRLFDLGARFGDDTGAGTVFTLAVIVAAILHLRNVGIFAMLALNHAQSKSKP